MSKLSDPMPVRMVRRSICCAAMAIAFTLTACQTEEVVRSDGRPLPEAPRAAPPVPADAQINRMAFMVGGKPEDTNRNGFPDLVHVTVALFAWPHPMAVRTDGTFVFQLFEHGKADRPGHSPLAEWRMEGDALDRAATKAPWGPSYQFQLSLAEKGLAIRSLSAADLRASFIPAAGSEVVHSHGVRSIQFGRR